MLPEERPLSAGQSRGKGPVCGVQHRWQDPGSHLHSRLLAKQRAPWELLQMERHGDQQVWEVPVPGAKG